MDKAVEDQGVAFGPGCQPSASAASASSQSGIPNAGSITWHCSEEEGGPDVGKSIALADGTELYFGEISRRTWEGVGGNEISETSAGWWIVHWRHDGPNVLGRALPFDFGQVETLASAMSAGTAKTAKRAEARRAASAVGEAETPKGEHP